MMDRIALRDFVKTGYWLVPVLWAAVVAILSRYFGEAYSPDSYHYYMLGKNVFSGNGFLTNVIRENFPEATFYSRSYPPVMPLLCGLADALFHKGISSGLIVDIAALYGMFHVCYLLGKTANDRFFYVPLVACFLFVLLNPSFADELIAGRSIPVAALLLLVLIFLSMQQGTFSRMRYMLTGACLGLGYLTRFDVALLCLIFPWLLCWARKDSWKNVLLIYAGLVLTISPWLIRNTLVFGQPFVSSNSVALWSLYDSDCPTLLFFSHGIPSWSLAPELWIRQRLHWLCHNILLVYTLLLPLGVLALPGGTLILYLVAKGVACGKNNKPVFVFMCIALLWSVVNLITVSLTKLPDERYFSVSVLLMFIGAGFGIAGMILKRTHADTPPCEQVAVSGCNRQAACFGIILVAVTFYVAFPAIGRDSNAAIMETMYADFKPYIAQDALVASDRYADNFAYYMPWKMIYFPPNITSPDEEDFIVWKKHFNVRYMIMMDKSGFVHYPGLKILAKSGKFILIDANRM